MTTAWQTSESASSHAPCPDGTCNRRRDAAADPAVRHHRHEHERRKHERNAGERIGTEKADEIGLRNADQRLRREDDQDRQCEADQVRCDRSMQQRISDRRLTVSVDPCRSPIATRARDRLVVRRGPCCFPGRDDVAQLSPSRHSSIPCDRFTRPAGSGAGSSHRTFARERSAAAAPSDLASPTG